MPSLLDLHYCSCVLCDLLPSALWYCWIRKEITWSQLLKEKIEGQLANPDSSKHVKLACVCVDLVHGQRNWGGLGRHCAPHFWDPGLQGVQWKWSFWWLLCASASDSLLRSSYFVQYKWLNFNSPGSCRNLPSYWYLISRFSSHIVTGVFFSGWLFVTC